MWGGSCCICTTLFHDGRLDIASDHLFTFCFHVKKGGGVREVVSPPCGCRRDWRAKDLHRGHVKQVGILLRSLVMSVLSARRRYKQVRRAGKRLQPRFASRKRFKEKERMETAERFAVLLAYRNDSGTSIAPTGACFSCSGLSFAMKRSRVCSCRRFVSHHSAPDTHSRCSAKEEGQTQEQRNRWTCPRATVTTLSMQLLPWN
ncbi:hypothetical protein GW17_00027456 [Ensete ventricosum]|nr:hypothetical protein GW17_00027456 [Ensete ventricosum]RZR98146.1 hypothetical protein BHM03_00027460 [Ensete ventricosum]